MNVLAHAKWFSAARGAGADWAFLTHPLTILAVGAAVVGAAAAIRVLGARPRPAAGPLASRLLAAALGAALVALALRQELLSPATALTGAPGMVLAAFEGLIGLWLLTGVRRRSAAATVGALLAASAVVAGPLSVLEAGHIVGIALFLTLRDVRALQLGLGGALVAVAFAEKLAFPDVTEALLMAEPALNMTPIGDHEFVRLAGAAEIFLGLLIASGAARRPVAIAAAAPFLATVAVFGFPELIGHLPVYAVLAVLATAGRRPVRLPAVVPPARPRVVLASIPSDSHSWNLVLLELTLAHGGYTVTNLGPCTPIDVLVATCAEQAPELVVVSTVNGHGHVEGRELIRSLRAHPALEGVTVVIGGKLGTLGAGNRRFAAPLVAAGYDAVFTEGDDVTALDAYLTDQRVQELAA